jgi:hypothetical protein
MNTIFKPQTSKVTKNHDAWTFHEMFQRFGSKNVNDKPKYQRPDVDGSSLLFGEGNQWQKNLMRDIIKGNPFQPIHLRDKNGIWEIVDGGHRTRTVYKFLNGFVRLPADTILYDINGVVFDISNMTFVDILKNYPILKDYIWNLTFEVYEYRDISDSDAEELFLKLNDLHDMSHADKRNAIDNIIADVCRERGAVDSPTAIRIFKETIQTSDGKKLAHVSLPTTKRTTDEMISFALYYLYKGGIFGSEFGGLEDQSELNDMYRDGELIKLLSDAKDNLISDLDSLLRIVNGVVMEGPLVSGRNGSWKKGTLKKLIMLITESARNAGGFGKYKPDIKQLHKQLKEAYVELSKSKVPHHPYRLYEVVGGKVVPLKESLQSKKVKKHETYQFPSVFSGGARLDDLLYVYHHFITKNMFMFGLKASVKDEIRTFNKTQNEEMWVEQGGKCNKCGVDLNTHEYAADHILGHSYGGPTDTKNGQLLCISCNSMKSNGMDVNDVKYLCEKYGYDDFSGLSKYVLGDSITLTESQIKKIRELVIDTEV